MQRTQRRFTCSTASAPSRSNTAGQSRRRSTPSSVAGDSLLLSREPRRARNEAAPRTKPRSTKARNARKGSQPVKSLRPRTSVLQNAIVLAPFHALKRCFQNKLVNLYSNEKMKKINRKIKMAEKQKMSFQYDIVELNQLGPTVKKEGKPAKPQQKLRSPSYCQCDRTPNTDCKKPPTRRKNKEPHFTPHLSSFIDTKRRKLDTAPLTPNILKADLSPRADLCSPNTSLPSDTNLTASRLSSRSKTSSSDFSTNSPSCKERLTGSLAISTTSFDSCLDHFGRPRCTSPPAALATRTRTPSLSQPANLNCLPNPNPDPSRHLIMHNGTNNSDGRIADFLDREPQTHFITPAQSDHLLHPLPRRRSKSRAPSAKKSEGSAPPAAYYLRSLTPAMELLPPDHVEVGTQVEGSGAPLKDDALAECPPAEEQPKAEEELEKCEGASEVESEVKEIEESVLEMVRGGDVLGLVGEAGGAGDVEGRCEGSSGVGGAEDGESRFIFGGSRNTESSLGESCKFSFGLNFVFSDDED